MLPQIGDLTAPKSLVKLLVDALRLRGREHGLPLADAALGHVSQVVFFLEELGNERVRAPLNELLEHMPVLHHRAGHAPCVQCRERCHYTEDIELQCAPDR